MVAVVASVALVGRHPHARQPAAPWPAGRPATFVNHFNGTNLDVPTEAPRRALFALNAWEVPLMRQIKATNPNAVVIMYKDLSSTRSYPGAVVDGIELHPTGVTYNDANTNHPDWFLKNTSGARLEWSAYADHWHMDVGNPAYQQAWLAGVRAELDRYGWDGVIFDNALTRATAYNNPGPAKYPTNTAMQAATRSMLAAVSPPLRQAGYLTIANISDSRLFPGLWNDWLTLLDGGAEEHFLDDLNEGTWEAQRAQIADAARAGRRVLMKVDADAPRDRVRLGLATFLLDAGDGSAFAVGDQSWFPEYEWRLGPPVGPARHLGGGVHRRDFLAAVVLVNAGTRPAEVDLGGPLIDEAGERVGAVSLAPKNAAILRTSSEGGPPPGR